MHEIFGRALDETYISVNVGLKLLANGLDYPTVMKSAVLPGKMLESLFVATRSGEIWNVTGDAKNLWLDITEKVKVNDECGLIGLAFHSNFNKNGLFWIYYTIRDVHGDNVPVSPVMCDDVLSQKQRWLERERCYDHVDVLEEWRVLEKGEPYFRRRILKIKHPFSNNNGFNVIRYSCQLEKLILSIGDGGSMYDPFNFSQDEDEIYGKLYSIDVARIKRSNNEIYPVTKTSELADIHGTCVKMLSKGLRNPGYLLEDYCSGRWVKYLIDGGQSIFESIYAFRSYENNFGWRAWEGLFPTSISNKCQGKINLPDHIIIWDKDNFPENGEGMDCTYRVGDIISLLSKDNMVHNVVQCDENWKNYTNPKIAVPDSYPLEVLFRFKEPGIYHLVDTNNQEHMRLKITIQKTQTLNYTSESHSSISGEHSDSSNEECFNETSKSYKNTYADVFYKSTSDSDEKSVFWDNTHDQCLDIFVPKSTCPNILYPCQAYQITNRTQPYIISQHVHVYTPSISNITGAAIYKGGDIPELKDTIIFSNKTTSNIQNKTIEKGQLYYAPLTKHCRKTQTQHLLTSYTNSHFVALGTNLHNTKIYIGTYTSNKTQSGCVYELIPTQKNNSCTESHSP